MSTPLITDDVRECARILSAGGLVGVPTETVYGLAALCSNDDAVRRVFSAKGRPFDHPLIVHVDSVDRARQYGQLNSDALALAECFWPGPLTVLVPRTDQVSDTVTGGRDTVALRVPAHPATLMLIDLCGEGLVAPSANRFGHVSPTTARHVVDDLDGLVDAVLDGGQCSVGVESTIVDCTTEPQVLRPGAVSDNDIADCMGRFPVSPTGPSRAPGMLASHYAPDTHMILADDRHAAEEIARSRQAAGRRTRIIGADLVPTEYAARLYSMLRDAERSGIQDLIAVLPHGGGISVAVRDRLTKAAAVPRD